ncbi:hypothetical protein PHLGIDRAFT_27787 [Phlebiopsis gigantea 11061_1 CR5-6]|uniref:RNA polymerase II subunit A C-terminal domain phosphatase n=1 Tax=Phlebiopsis gigantea (strain 11061_1 CR5-6) TaxID=745531 RepID=A0A0C3P1U4_PHLG1|nr:hypothetical protein PHLGIDRAFT_27787 [Phlebiopsis gigantea 11061_1 CR5-6]
MSDTTELFLPPHLPYPIKVVAHAVHPAESVQRGTRLLSYSFTHDSPETGKEIRFGTWDSSIEGSVDSWAFRPGDVVSQRRAREVPAIKILEPCKHGIQLGGLCCICGKDMTDYDYTGFSDASRASIQMTHTANGPTVSLEEAQRIERETAEHLRKSRKLSLIVDLDQTIVHATVDPTVGEWIAEEEAWQARHPEKAERVQGELNGEGEPSSQPVADDDDDDDERNPNWEALMDVKKFRLGPEALGNPRLRGSKTKAKDKSVENEGCMYYIKPRPGWEEFLEDMAEKYEMHVYTMGTRAYAEEVCAAIDPEGKIFGGRLLSRDESGSLTQKSLQRLFPCDQSMVVIIDDRADIWEWSPNLVKVIPFEFFVGIGDINSAFLPKQQSIAPVSAGASTPDAPLASTSTDIIAETTPDSPFASTSTSPSSTEEELAEIAQNEILSRNADELDAQLEERPLAKKQEELQEAEEAEEAEEAANASNSSEASADDGQADTTVNGVESPRTPSPTREKHKRKALLKNSDRELVRIQRILEEIHRQYYMAHDERPREEKPAKKRNKRSEQPPSPFDVRLIIPSMRQTVLAGTHVLFSSVIPLDMRPEASETWRIAQLFGAKCYTELNPRITHVVAAKRGTVKVDAARRQGGIKIVWVAWFTDSISQWRRQDEAQYLIDPETAAVVGPASPPSDAHQISSDPEPDADDWDYERGAAPVKSIELDGVDWDEINDEVDAAMNESDDDDGDDAGSTKSGVRSGNVSEDDWTDETNSIIRCALWPRKRLRSLTPLETAVASDSDNLRSPLAKRKKLAAERSGTSRLKEAISAEDIVTVEEDEETKTRSSATPTSVTGNAGAGGNEEDDMNDDDDDDDDDDDSDDSSSSSSGGGGAEEDDFLARELGEDWG